MSSLIQHAADEMKRAGLYNEDTIYGGMLPDAVLELVKVFADQGHSGGSAPIVIDLFSKVARFKTLSPITGEDDEWQEVDVNMAGIKELFQNRRCFALFKDGKDGQANYNEAILWRNQHGSTYSGPAMLNGVKYTSRGFVKSYPFTPKTFIIDVIEEEVEKDNWVFHIKDVDQFNEVRDYYDIRHA